MGDISGFLLTLSIFVFTATAAVCDWRTKKIPNVVTAPAAVIGIIFHLTVGAFRSGFSGAVQGIGFSLAGFATGFGIFYLLWLIGSSGGGDVKLMGALGSWLGAMLTLWVLAVSVVYVAIGVVFTVVWELYRGGATRTRRRFMSPRGGRTGRSKGVEAAQKERTRRRLTSFGVAAAFATWTVLGYMELREFLLQHGQPPV